MTFLSKFLKIRIRISRTTALVACAVLVVGGIAGSLVQLQNPESVREAQHAATLDQVVRQSAEAKSQLEDNTAQEVPGDKGPKPSNSRDATSRTPADAKPDNTTADEPSKDKAPVTHERKLLFSLPEVTISSGSGYSQPFSIRTDDGRAVRMPNISTGKNGPFIITTNSYPGYGVKLATWTNVVISGNPSGSAAAFETQEVYITVTDKSPDGDTWHYGGYLKVIVEP